MPTRPNILIVMADQFTGTLFPDGPAAFLHAPNLSHLAARSLRFANAYCPSPLCAPARASVMSGRMPAATGVYDNAAEFPSSLPCFTHHLRRAGYRTILSGKMHFVGPDQLHGFEERRTTDIYPADFGWTPDWRRPGERIDWWYHNLGSVTGAGVAEITNQYDYDDEVAYHARAALYDLARMDDGRPWCLTVSFTHPHDPFVARRALWDLYEGCPALEPPEPIPYAAQDPHGRRLLDACDWRRFPITPADIARARRGYFANISYIDAQLGALLAVLEATRQEAAVVFLSDHGEMLGERGLWFKMNFFEGAARVPLLLAAPGLAPGRIDTPVSTLDLAATLCDLAGIDLADVLPWSDGESLLPLAAGTPRTSPVAMEYAAEGSVAPMVALRQGPWKYIRCPADPELLFNLEADPAERVNRAADPAADAAADPAAAAALAGLRAEADRRWNLAAFDAAVRDSQQRRLIVYAALRNGAFYPWDHQPLARAADRYMRNHMDLNLLEEARRWPRGE
jgi:choline-sulfatase